MLAALKIVGLLLLGGLLYGVYAVARRRLRARKNSPERLLQRLVALTHDAEVAERLVARMRKKHPHLGEAELIRRAIKQLRRDRGR